MDELPMLLRVIDVAALLQISRSQAYLMVLSNDLPHVHFGRAVRIPRAALDRWIEQHIEGNLESVTEVASEKPALRIGSQAVAQ